MADKSPLDTFLENVNFHCVGRDVLGEELKSDKISDLKQELFYYRNQAAHGPEKSRHVMGNKADKIEAEIKRLEALKSH